MASSQIKLLAMFVLTFAIFGPAGRISAADVKLSGQIYTHYEYANSEFFMNGARAENFNAFDVGQVQLNASSRLNDRMDAFLKAETTMLSRDNTSNQLYLKQAWLRLNGIFPGANLRFGLVPYHVWRDHEENIWKHRFVAEILEDIEKLLPASDRGVLLSGTWRQFSYNAAITNGEGMGARTTAGNEVNKYKSFTGKVSLAPFENETLRGLKFNSQFQYGQKFNAWPRNRIFYGISYESQKFSGSASWHTSKDGLAVAAATSTLQGEGFSVYGVFFVNKNYWLFGRWDVWDSDVGTADNAHDRIIYGIGAKLAESVRLALDHQLILQQQIASNRRNQSLLAVHAEIKF